MCALCPFAVKRIQGVVNSVEGVLCCHDVSCDVKDDGLVLNLAVQLPGNLPFDRANEIAKLAQKRLQEEFPHVSKVNVRAEPEGCPTCKKKAEEKAATVHTMGSDISAKESHLIP